MHHNQPSTTPELSAIWGLVMMHKVNLFHMFFIAIFILNMCLETSLKSMMTPKTKR
jgi:hypothetical protein